MGRPHKIRFTPRKRNKGQRAYYPVKNILQTKRDLGTGQELYLLDFEDGDQLWEPKENMNKPLADWMEGDQEGNLEAMYAFVQETLPSDKQQQYLVLYPDQFDTEDCFTAVEYVMKQPLDKIFECVVEITPEGFALASPEGQPAGRTDKKPCFDGAVLFSNYDVLGDHATDDTVFCFVDLLEQGYVSPGASIIITGGFDQEELKHYQDRSFHLAAVKSLFEQEMRDLGFLPKWGADRIWDRHYAFHVVIEKLLGGGK